MDVNTEKLPGTGIEEEITEVEVMREASVPPELPPEKEKNTTIAENPADSISEFETPGISVIPFVSRLVCLILCVIGVFAYGYLGICGIQYVKNGGYVDLVGDRIFGGVIAQIKAEPVPDEEELLPETDVAPDNLANAEYIKISTEDIGSDDPSALFNETDYDPDTDTVPVSAVIPAFDENDAVLIVHTHGTEGYAPEGQVTADEDFRTDDPEESVIAAGSAFAEILESRGVPVIHCQEMFDKESYIDSYNRSAEAVQKYMKEYPEIRYVIDIHRDAVIREDGTVVRSDGGSGAQLMIVCGTDEMGADFPDWRENFAFGEAYQQKLYAAAPELVRHMNLRSASFNQQLCDRYLLLEIGTCGNSLDEAVRSARIAADTFADLILGE